MEVTTVTDIAKRITELEEQISNADNLIKLARSAGEDVFQLEQKLKQLKIRLDKWRSAVKEQGV